MVQDISAPVITTREPYKTVYMNGVNGNTGSPTTGGPHGLINTNTESSPAMHHLPIAIPMPMPMLAPMAHHHPHHHPHHPHQQPPPPQQAFFPSMGPPAVVTGPPQPQQQQPSMYSSTDQSYCDYLYHVGFLQGLFSDITVNVPALQKSYALHSLMLSRSSMLYRQLLGLVHQHPPVIELDIAASPETIHTVLGHLYRPLTQHDLFFIVNEKPPRMCFELLDAAHELELDSLQSQIIHILPRSFNQNTILYWISTLLSQQQQQQRRPWSDLVDQQIVHYLTSGLPRQLEGSPTSTCDHSEEEDEVKFGTCVKLPDPTDGWHDTLDDWARLYAELPLEYLKRCLEHKELMVKDSVERYKFAKRVLHFREKMGKRGLAVMLQFSSSDSNTGILIVKKQASKFGRWRPTAV